MHGILCRVALEGFPACRRPLPNHLYYRIKNAGKSDCEYDQSNILSITLFIRFISKNSSTPSYEENYVTHAESTHYIYREFNLPQFIAGLEFDDSMLGSSYPVQASLVSMFMGGLNSCLNSVNSAYIDIDYLIATGSGHRRAIARAGSTTYNEKFKYWDYNLTEQSVKTSLSTFWNGVPAWYGYLQDDVNELVKNTYRALKMIEAMPNPDTVVVCDDVQYDMLVTLDEDRKDAKYSS